MTQDPAKENYYIYFGTEGVIFFFFQRSMLRAFAFYKFKQKKLHY